LDIDVVGADLVRRYIAALPAGDPLREGFTDIFIEPPSIEELRRRLEGRAEDSKETIELRLKNAQGEMDRAGEFTYRVVNDELELAYRRLRDIVLVRGGLL
jgi:guanylate kinase